MGSDMVRTHVVVCSRVIGRIGRVGVGTTAHANRVFDGCCSHNSCLICDGVRLVCNIGPQWASHAKRQVCTRKRQVCTGHPGVVESAPYAPKLLTMLKNRCMNTAEWVTYADIYRAYVWWCGAEKTCCCPVLLLAAPLCGSSKCCAAVPEGRIRRRAATPEGSSRCRAAANHGTLP